MVGRSQDNPYKFISGVWRKFSERFYREFGRRLGYIRVTESHEDGNPHFHFLTHERLDVAWVRANWVECGGGRIMKVKHVEGKNGDTWETGVAKYLSKYFSKNNMELPKGVRHYETNYEVPPPPKTSSFEPVKATLMVRWLWVNRFTLEAVEAVHEATSGDIALALSRPNAGDTVYFGDLG